MCVIYVFGMLSASLTCASGKQAMLEFARVRLHLKLTIASSKHPVQHQACLNTAGDDVSCYSKILGITKVLIE